MGDALFTFVWWGDGYFVYDQTGKYVGTDDQVDLIYELHRLNFADILNEDLTTGDPGVLLSEARDTLAEMREAIDSGGDPW